MENGIYSADHFFDEVIQLLEDEKTLAPLREAVKLAADWRSRLSAIRALYQAYERLGRDDFEHCDPYDFGLHDYWTPMFAWLCASLNTSGLTGGRSSTRWPCH